MKKLVEQIAEKIAIKYNLDKDALLNENSRIFYMNIGDQLLQVDKNTHISRCISSDEKIIALFVSIQTLLFDCY